MTRLEDTDEYKRGYTRGYSRGYAAKSSGRWPDHRPRKPPDAIIGGLVEALQKLRDAVDGELAKFDPEDPLVEKLGPLVDAADIKLEKLGKWIRTGEAKQ